MAKITVLVAIIVFIQKRPQGIFALKGRFANKDSDHAQAAIVRRSCPSLDTPGLIASAACLALAICRRGLDAGAAPAAAEDPPLHVSTYAITLLGKIMCYALVAVAMDLIWGYGGILSSATACSSPSAATPSGCT